MSYQSQAALSNDSAFIQRVAAAAAIEVDKTHQPLQWSTDHIWWIAAAPGFAAAYESAIVAGNPDPGNDPAVISDGQILSAVQALIGQEAAQEAAP